MYLDSKTKYKYRSGYESAIIYDKILSTPPFFSLHTNFSICSELRRNVALHRKILAGSTLYFKSIFNLDFNDSGLYSKKISCRSTKLAATSSTGI